MRKQSIPCNLYREALGALSDLFYYECPERFALQRVAESGRRGEALEEIFITTARSALDRHPVAAARTFRVA